MNLDLPSDTLLQGHVRVEMAGGVLHVILDRPDARNAQTPATWAALAAIGAALEREPGAAGVLVIRGEGSAFSAGLDRRMFTAEGIPGETSLAGLAAMPDDVLATAIGDFQRAFLWQRNVPTLTIAAVDGPAIGAGFQLALACDVLLASSSASFAMRETSYGLVPDLAGTQPLVRAVGYSRAVELCATGRTVSADEGFALGFVTRVSADLEGLVDEVSRSVLAAPPGAVAALKPLLAGAEDRSRAEQAAAERLAQVDRLRSLLSGA